QADADNHRWPVKTDLSTQRPMIPLDDSQFAAADGLEDRVCGGDALRHPVSGRRADEAERPTLGIEFDADDERLTGQVARGRPSQQRQLQDLPQESVQRGPRPAAEPQQWSKIGVGQPYPHREQSLPELAFTFNAES